MLFSHQVVIFSKVNPVYLFKRLWMSERSYLCSAQPGHALQGSTDRWRQQVPSFTLVEASKPWDWPRSPRQEAALGRATRPSTFYTPSTLGTRTWATRAEQARPSPLTLRTGVRYSATSRAFPFTVLITFCILGLGAAMGHGGTVAIRATGESKTAPDLPDWHRTPQRHRPGRG